MRSNLFSVLLLLLPVFALADGDRGAKRALQSMAVPPDLNTAREMQVPRMELVVSYEPLHVTKDGDVLASEVPLNEVHAWKLNVRDLHGHPVTLPERGLRIEGDMPQHSHGMVTRPTVSEVREGEKVRPGEYRAGGMLFHMPGWWVVTVLVKKDNIEEKVRFNLLVGPPLTTDDKTFLRSLHYKSLKPLQASDFPTNPYALNPRAAALGKKLFFDPRLSESGQMSCATCHDPKKAFTVEKTFEIKGHGPRKVPSLIGVARQKWFLWDGRADSLWAQALTPFENVLELNLPVELVVARAAAHYEAELREVFGEPVDAEESFIRIGQALAAYETTLEPAPSLFDRYLESIPGLIEGMEHTSECPSCQPHFRALLADCGTAKAWTPAERAELESLPVAEKQPRYIAAGVEMIRRGLDVFTGAGRCIQCHHGPRFSNDGFHNTGVPTIRGSETDDPVGRSRAIAKVRLDPRNCQARLEKLGILRGKSVGQQEMEAACGDLLALRTRDTKFIGAFKTPSLRNVALLEIKNPDGKAPYMHNGRLQTLEEVVNHYVFPPRAMTGKTEPVPLQLEESDKKALACFLKSLTEERYLSGETSQ